MAQAQYTDEPAVANEPSSCESKALLKTQTEGGARLRLRQDGKSPPGPLRKLLPTPERPFIAQNHPPPSIFCNLLQ